MFTRWWLPISGGVIATAILLGAHSPVAPLSLLLDGLPAALVVAAAAGVGVWPAAWLLRELCPGLRTACLGCALGLGVLGDITLLLGVAGWMNRPAAIVLVMAGLLLGAVWLHQRSLGRLQHAGNKLEPGIDTAQHARKRFWACALAAALLVVPAAVLLYGASLPPGMLWTIEARGYDALEYHLQAPREYYDAGRIIFLPHNVYASFPQQIEMLYLLLMHLLGGPYAAAVAAQFLHALLAGLTVATIAAWSRPGWARLAAIATAASVPWLVVLGTLAYVECGMFFFAAVACGMLLTLLESGGNAWRVAVGAGLCAGLASGCKYTAVVFVAVGLTVACVVMMRGGLWRRMRLAGTFALVAAATFSPWLIRNAAIAGNPVYPFAYELFGGRAWSAEQAAQWDRAHHLPPGTSRWRLAAHELFGQWEPAPSDLPRASRRSRGATLVRERSIRAAPVRKRTMRGNTTGADRSLTVAALTGQPRAAGAILAALTGRFHPSPFGAGLFVLAVLGGLAARNRSVGFLACWAGLMLAAWMGLTHMPGRFAAVVLVPGALLVGVGVEHAGRRMRGVLVVLAVLACAAGAWQLWRSLAGEEAWWAARSVDLRTLPGQTAAVRAANMLNDVVPADGLVWIVGDAAVFYVDRPMHYTVVFSRDPWLTFAGGGASPRACVEWLRSRGVTHVLFDWAEIRRLASTYGFADIATPEWVARLAKQGGLRPVELPGPGSARVLFVVPTAE